MPAVDSHECEDWLLATDTFPRPDFPILPNWCLNAEECFWAHSTSFCCSGNGTHLHPCESISTVNERENKVRVIPVLHKLKPSSHARQCAAANEKKTKENRIHSQPRKLV